MSVNVMKISASAKLPAGIVEGTEAFWISGEKWLIHEGSTMKFTEAPAKVQNMIVEIFRNDDQARKILKKEGLVKFSEQFDAWYKCRIGALDNTPDFLNGKLNVDAYNSACTDMECPMRGKLCSVSAGLRNYEVQTIKLLQQGYSVKKAANKLSLSHAGMKSRVELLKQKFDAVNMAEMITRATALGI